jgi:hypothetical protein
VKIRVFRKAPEDWRTPRRFADFEHHQMARSVLDCGSPLPLFPATHQIVPMIIETQPFFQFVPPPLRVKIFA